jgi:chorismate--pyruvate lyase
LGPQADWSPLATVEPLAPPELLSWLAEPGLLTARVRALCGERMRFRMLGPLRDATLPAELHARLRVPDQRCLLRDIEFCCDGERIVYAQTVLPEPTLRRYPWLRELGDSPLGETLRRAAEPLEREPLEYAQLPPRSELATAAIGADPTEADGGALWARRAVYRLGGEPILVQEVFLPALLRVQRALESTRRSP